MDLDDDEDFEDALNLITTTSMIYEHLAPAGTARMAGHRHQSRSCTRATV